MKNPAFIKIIITISIPFILIYLVSCDRCKDNGNKSSQNIAECYEFADEHWIKDDYKNWLHDSLGIEPDANGEISDTSTYWDPDKDEWTYLSHHLPDKKTDQYYEMIGKYDQFRFGWDDFPEENLKQEHRNEYLACLDRATKNKNLSPTAPTF
jgi:hypothetical protein